ncbi:MAG: PIN domain-containing protein [Candidatus Angelobacter sp.]
MKKTFSGYYQPTKEEFAELWKSCIFAFDASVLLDLYRSTAKTRNVLLGILDKMRERIWIPYQAALEYQENRLEVISKERTVYADLKDSLNNLANAFEQRMQNHAVENADKIAEELGKATNAISEIIDKGSKDHPDLIRTDHIRERVTSLFEGRIGTKYDDKRLAEIFASGAKRYEQKVPPGYEDAKKGAPRQYGDLIVWNEMLDYAKAKKCSIVFITSDSKEDWWWKQGQFTIGPRAELVQELMGFADQRFYMYSVPRFLEEAEQNLHTQVGSAEVKQAANEFGEIQTLREEDAAFKKLTPEQRTNVYDRLADILGGQPPESRRLEVQARLASIPSAELSHVSITFLLEGVSLHLQRQVTSDEIKEVLGLIGKKTFDQWISPKRTCWDMSRLFAAYLALSSKDGVTEPK